MTRRMSFGMSAGALLLAATAALATPAAAQLARPRVAAADAPKLLIAPFVRDNPDSALSLLIADGVRDRVRVQFLDKFNLITRQALNTVLTESGFPVDIPIEPAHLKQIVRFVNIKYVIEGSMIRKPGDSVLIVARLAEATGNTPQSISVSLMTPAGRLGSATGVELANRLVAGYAAFDEVAECRRQVEAGNILRAQQLAGRALAQSAGNAGAWLCMAQIREAQNAPDDSVIAALRNAYTRDTLSTAVMRRLATKYQARNDTTALLDMLKRILTIDFRDNELMTSTAQLMVRMGQPDSAVAVVNKGLRENPASVELLGIKAVAMSAGNHWDSAYAMLQTLSEIDSSKVDSLFIYRITNYARQIPDSTKWLTWVVKATEKFPTQLDYWYTLAVQRLSKGDSTGAEAAARGLLAHVSDSTASRAMAARAAFVLSSLAAGHGQSDTALAYADRAVRGDSTLKGSVAAIYLQAGARARGDTATAGYLERSIELLTKAKEYAAGTPRMLVQSGFQLGVAQFQFGAKVDARAQEGRSCELARQARALMDESEANIIIGAAANRELANKFLSEYIPAYKQRGNTMIRQYCR